MMSLYASCKRRAREGAGVGEGGGSSGNMAQLADGCMRCMISTQSRYVNKLDMGI